MNDFIDKVRLGFSGDELAGCVAFACGIWTLIFLFSGWAEFLSVAGFIALVIVGISWDTGNDSEKVAERFKEDMRDIHGG